MSFYPINPDTTVESFILTDDETQKNYFGKIYNISELVPMNYRKIFTAAYAGVPMALTYAPLRQYVHIRTPKPFADVSDETTNDFQSKNLLNALTELGNYWKTDLAGVPAFQCPMGVVTEIKTEVEADPNYLANPAYFYIKTTIKVVWFVVPGSLFS